MVFYREIAPPPALAAAVECFWTGAPGPADPPHRVFPDGCTDVLFTRSSVRCTVEAVGAMTGYRDFAIPADRVLVGARFRPGGWPAVWGPPATDSVLPFEELVGGHARGLLDRLTGAPTTGECVRLLANAIPVTDAYTPVQRAIAAIERAHGSVSLDEMASQAGLSSRQFRRVCLHLTGLTPKFLSQVLRFRHAQSRLATAGAATLALDCGYYDQAHFINEFLRFSGRTPGAALMADFSNRSTTLPR